MANNKITDWEDVPVSNQINDWEDVSPSPVIASASSVEPTASKVSMLESLLRGAAQGASFGFADEITGALESALTDKTYEQARDESRAAYAAAEAENPATYTAGTFAGGFALPGLGVAKGLSRVGLSGLKLAAASGALGGGLGSAIQTVGDTKEGLPTLEETAKNAAVGTLGGAAFGAGAHGAGKLLGKGIGAVKDTKFADDLAKVYENVRKSGKSLQGRDVEQALNKEMIDASGEITEKMVSNFKKMQNEYGQEIEKLKIGKPEAVQAKLDALVDDIAKDYAIVNDIDIREVNRKINLLRDSKALNQDEINDLLQTVMKKQGDIKAMRSDQQFALADKKLDQSDIIKVYQDASARFQDTKTQLQRMAQDLKKQPKSPERESRLAQITEEMRKTEDAISQIKNTVRDIRHENRISNVNENITNKAQTGIAGDVSAETEAINRLQGQNVDIDRQISDLVGNIGQHNNSAYSTFLDKINNLRNAVIKPDFTMKQFNNAADNEINKLTDTLGRPDLAGKIKSIVLSGMEDAPKLNAKYKNEVQKLKTLGINPDDSAASLAKDDRVIRQLTEKMKNAGKDNTSAAANEIENLKTVVDTPEISDLLNKGTQAGENYALNRQMYNAGLTTPGGYGLRGADITGQAVNAIDNMKTVQIAKKLASKLGDTPQGRLINKALTNQAPERALFVLAQQPWYRKLSESENGEK